MICRWKMFLLIIIAIAFLSHCAMINKFRGKGIEVEESAAELMSDGQEKMNRGYYKDATAIFQKVKDRYPYSKYAATAELKIADTLYIQELYTPALDAYSEFEKLHPKSKEIPYVIFQKGLCHSEQVRSFDRDQSQIKLAREEFERLIRLYPQDEYARKAQSQVRECLISLAKYELYIAHFYFKKGKYQAALDRYLYLIGHYPDMGQYQEALEYIALCKQRIAEE